MMTVKTHNLIYSNKWSKTHHNEHKSNMEVSIFYHS